MTRSLFFKWLLHCQMQRNNFHCKIPYLTPLHRWPSIHPAPLVEAACSKRTSFCFGDIKLTGTSCDIRYFASSVKIRVHHVILREKRIFLITRIRTEVTRTWLWSKVSLICHLSHYFVTFPVSDRVKLVYRGIEILIAKGLISSFHKKDIKYISIDRSVETVRSKLILKSSFFIMHTEILI